MASRKSFRIGRVRGDLRGKIWYLAYHENGQRQRPRIGSSKDAARQMAAEINAQLETGAPSALNFEPIPITELQRRWLDHHEHVLRSSVRTIVRYRCATKHFVDFVESLGTVRTTAQFHVHHAERFVRYLRTLRVAPNGHPNAAKRLLLDKGIKYILETSRTLFNYGIKRRHLPPYAENPFGSLDLDRIPVENAKPIVVLSPEQEQQLLDACDDWQFPLFLTLMMTGLRPGELCHLLLPEDLDLDRRLLRVRNKPRLGWQVKTRSEREIPLVTELVDVLRTVIGNRAAGLVFQRRRFHDGMEAPFARLRAEALEQQIAARASAAETQSDQLLDRVGWHRIARSVWRDAGAIKIDHVRKEFMALTKVIELPHLTAPKLLRHHFATCLQDANVDPLIRCELMGHSVAAGGNGHGLGMTATYTHTRPETKRDQLERALAQRPALLRARQWLAHRSATNGPTT